MDATPEIRDDQGRFRKGHSGNPGGRPRGVTFAKILAAELTEAEAIAIVRAMFRRAKRGDVRAFQAIADRVDGRPAVVVTGGEDDDGNARAIPIKLL